MSKRNPLAPLLTIPLLGAGLLVVAPTAPPRQPLAPLLAVPLGAFTGVALATLLAHRRQPMAPIGAGLVVGVAGAGEEALWRVFVLGRLASAVGVVGAVVLSAVGFAVTHFPAQRLRGIRAQLGTGLVFGTLYAASGSLVAAMSAHGVYNVLVLVGLRGVKKRFGNTIALRGVDLSVAPGEVVALLGPNGAGKTTLVNVLLGIRRPDAGDVQLRGSVGVTPQEVSFPPTLRVREIVDFVRAHYPEAEPARLLLERFSLMEIAKRQTGGISGGQQRRLAIALAFAGNPQLAVLDEPTAGLDVESRLQVWDAIRTYARAGGAVLLTTHHLEEAEALATRIVVLANGLVVADGATVAADGESLEEAYLRLTR
ncbi:MAG TPA: ATP-binding cassette domain-containing protein [Gaiellaceae bacterium]|nr:ATP-binding cassette domain-containing protein [Gaiellaceae bacterium]